MANPPVSNELGTVCGHWPGGAGRQIKREARAEVFLIPFVESWLASIRRTCKFERYQGILIRRDALQHVLRALAEPLAEVKFFAGRPLELAGSNLETIRFPWRRRE